MAAKGKGLSAKGSVSRRPVNSDVGPLIMASKTPSSEEIRVADAYLDLANPDAHDWAAGVLLKADRDEKFEMVMSVVERAHLPEDQEALGYLGAGAMEDLMSDWLLDRLKDYLPFTHELRCCLSAVRMGFEPRALHERLLRMRGVH